MSGSSRRASDTAASERPTKGSYSPARMRVICQPASDRLRILRRAGEVAPAMGLIGTLVGLVQMLGQLEDPSSIGPAMAVALLTTFYGAILANMFFLPLATKLERNAGVEAQVKQIYALGAASIARQENPRRLEVALNATLPPTERVRFFD